MPRGGGQIEIRQIAFTGLNCKENNIWVGLESRDFLQTVSPKDSGKFCRDQDAQDEAFWRQQHPASDWPARLAAKEGD